MRHPWQEELSRNTPGTPVSQTEYLPIDQPAEDKNPNVPAFARGKVVKGRKNKVTWVSYKDNPTNASPKRGVTKSAKRKKRKK